MWGRITICLGPQADWTSQSPSEHYKNIIQNIAQRSYILHQYRISVSNFRDLCTLGIIYYIVFRRIN